MHIGALLRFDPAAIRARVEEAVRAACPETALEWTGGRLNPGETPADHPFTKLVLQATSDECGRKARTVGVSYGADMRLFCERGIPCVMVGTPGLERAHAVDEHVALADLEALARILIRVIARVGR